MEQYKNAPIAHAELRSLLGFDTRYRLDGFLKAHEVWIDSTLDDAMRELESLERLGF